ncbi:PssD/Cps14F family polysaccharide biosynthesis glycosyltransferase [Pyrococcus kukulkanii]|uniref:PssD/Cps14F family polysaccharide biosynthesis glycosyltransferase n=1 Tax=Pyrococcus kukulkanii TaxID=1609559 RepID=A0ABV4T4Q3_9EURY
MKVGIICSPGGHLTEMLQLIDAVKGHEVFLITYSENFLNLPREVKRVYKIRNLLVEYPGITGIKKGVILFAHFLLLLIKELQILLKERPDILISTGSEIAIPAFYIARLLNIKTVYIESVCRIDDISFTGKAVYWISDLFIVQWKKLAERYSKAKYLGNVLVPKRAHINQSKTTKKNVVFVTIGTAPFDRLIKLADEISPKLEFYEMVIQKGRTKYTPKNSKYFSFVPEYKDIIRFNMNSKIIISHGGVGSIILALKYGAILVLFPRLSRYGEHNDDHQLEIAKFMKYSGLSEVAYTEEELYTLVTSLANYPANYTKTLLRLAKKIEKISKNNETNLSNNLKRALEGIA